MGGRKKEGEKGRHDAASWRRKRRRRKSLAAELTLGEQPRSHDNDDDCRRTESKSIEAPEAVGSK